MGDRRLCSAAEGRAAAVKMEPVGSLSRMAAIRLMPTLVVTYPDGIVISSELTDSVRLRPDARTALDILNGCPNDVP